jgi:hypothetical protein
VLSGARGLLTGRDGRDQTTDDKPEPEEVPPHGSQQAWGQTQGKPQMGLALFSVKGNYAMPVYINLVDIRGGGKELTIYLRPGHNWLRLP